jgi:hypothetical protein
VGQLIVLVVTLLLQEISKDVDEFLPFLLGHFFGLDNSLCVLVVDLKDKWN